MNTTANIRLLKWALIPGMPVAVGLSFLPALLNACTCFVYIYEAARLRIQPDQYIPEIEAEYYTGLDYIQVDSWNDRDPGPYTMSLLLRGKTKDYLLYVRERVEATPEALHEMETIRRQDAENQSSINIALFNSYRGCLRNDPGNCGCSRPDELALLLPGNYALRGDRLQIYRSESRPFPLRVIIGADRKTVRIEFYRSNAPPLTLTYDITHHWLLDYWDRQPVTRN